MDASLIIYTRQKSLFKRLDITANNIANQNTSGFKKDLAVYFDAENKIDGKRNPTATMTSVTNYNSGEFTVTGRKLDVAIQGDGFFEVETPLGSRYTRAGSLQMNTEGVITTVEGYPVLGDGGQLTLNAEDRDIDITENGEIFAQTANGIEQRGTLGVVRFLDRSSLRKVGENLFASDILPEAALAGEEYKVAQGVLESSNVKPVDEISELIKINRDVAMTAKIMSDQSDLMRNSISRITRIE